MLDKAKNFLRPHVRAIQRGGQYPVLVPGHTPTAAGLQTADGATRAVAPELSRALTLCDGTRTLKQVAKQSGVARTDLIRAHEDGLVLMWRSSVPAAAPAPMGHAPHSIILSPHLDDAALSCGGRMLGDRSVLVVNVFNKSAWWRFPHTVADADRIQACRNVEEAMISRLSGAVIRMLDLPEALLRGHAMAELFTAKPDDRDAEVAAKIRDAVTKLAREYPLAHWFLPLAIGEHIDHHIVRDAAMTALAGAGVKSTHLHFYEDLPYAARLGPEADFANHIPGQTLREESLDIEDQLPWKLELLRAYWSQFRLGEFTELGRYAKAVGGSEAAEITWTPA